MKYGILMAIMAASSLSLAQSSTTSLSSDLAAEGSSSATQVQTSTETLTTVAPKTAKKWGGSFIIQAFTDVRDQQKFGTKAASYSDNYIGANYALSDKLKLEIGYNFSVMNNVNAPKADTDSFHSNYEGRSPEIILKQTLGKIGNSDPVGLTYYYYVPMGLYTKQIGGNGVLRFDATTTWNFKKVSISPWFSNRTYLGNSANTADTDTIYRFNIGPIMAYNFNDALNVYYVPYTDVRTSTLNYGKVQFNKKNQLVHEVGINWTTTIAKAKVTVNPAFVNYQHLENGQGFGRNYYASNDGTETNTGEIDLNVVASF